MGWSLLRNCLIAWLLVSGLCCHAFAKHPSRKHLQATLQRLSAQADLRTQVGALQKWQRQWQKEGYPSDSTYINGLLELGLAHLYRNEYSAATQVVRQAVRLCQTRRRDIANDQPAKALYRLGMLLSEQNQPAMDTLRKAVKRGQGIRSANQWVGYAYLYLAYTYYSAGDFQQALNCIESGEQVARNTNVKSLIVKLLHEKAKVLNELERYDPARRTAERAVVLSEQDVYPAVIARSYRLLGVIAKNQEHYSDALRYGQRAFDIARKIQDPTAPDYAASVGVLYYQLRRYDQAIPYFQFGIDNNTNSYAKAYSLTKLGETYQQKKEFLRALHYYQQGLTSLPLGFRNLVITSLPDARSIRLADQKDYLLTLIRDKADTWLDYAKATNNNRQRLQYALNTYKVADQMIDFMRWDHTADESKLYWRQTTRDVYERAIETCYWLGDTEQAFRFFEKSRAVMLADKLNELGARQQLSGSQIQTEKELREAVRSQQNELATLLPDSANYTSVRDGLSTRQDQLATFLTQLEASNPTYYRYKYDTTVAKLADLQPHLASRQASFLTYFVGDSALYLLGVTGDKATLCRQPIRGHGQQVRAFMALLANPDAMNRTANFARFLTLGQELYRQLLAPLKLANGAVIVSPDGSFLPFEALSLSATKPVYAVDKYAFSYVYSARLMLRDNQRPTARFRGNTFLGVAPVVFAPALKQVSLHGSDKALEPIADRFRSSVLLTHESATRRSFLNQAPDARIIHLFTHASADNEPKLYFADSTLQLSDLGDGSLPNAQLVVLAACQTGVGANQRGEGVFSLARGFAALGAPSILTTLWSVENEATYRITNLFYAYINQGLAKDIALQRAKQDWLKTAGGLDRLPNTWAGLIIVGDTQPLDQPAQWAWVAGGLLLLGAAGAGVWWRRKRPTKPALSLPHAA